MKKTIPIMVAGVLGVSNIVIKSDVKRGNQVVMKTENNKDWNSSKIYSYQSDSQILTIYENYRLKSKFGSAFLFGSSLIFTVWEPESKMIFIYSKECQKEKGIILKIGEKEMLAGGRRIFLSFAPALKNGMLYLPLQDIYSVYQKEIEKEDCNKLRIKPFSPYRINLKLNIQREENTFAYLYYRIS